MASDVAAELPKGLTQPTLRAALGARRTADGTLLPDTRISTRDVQRLVAELPRVEIGSASPQLRMGETLGQGGMGVVRRAEQRSVGRPVAVKTLRPEHDDPQLVVYLLREAWLTGRLEHPNIVPVHDVGLDAEGRPIIVMKRIAGQEWAELLADPTHDLRRHLSILEQVANAVELAGSRGIVHRDLKPSNVMVGAFGEVYVLDWGIAVSLHEDPDGRLPLARDVRGVSGTPGYMAPEMVQDTGEGLDPRTDVYLLGAILHELITKTPRHTGDNLQAVLLSSAASEPVDYPDYVPRELCAIANRATAREPEDRFADAGAFRDAIRAFLEHDGSRALCDAAQDRLREWASLQSADTLRVQALFSEARLGFEQALKAWPENREAQSGLQICLERKFDYDLERDDFASASTVAAALAARTEDQEARLAELEARIASRRVELDELRALQAGRDLDVGRRTRAFLMLLTAVSFGLIPVLEPFVARAGLPAGFVYFYAASLSKLVLGGALAYWARESLSKTQVNRQLTASMFLLMAAELATRPFAQRLAHTVEHSLFIDFGLYTLVNATLAITIDRRLLAMPLVYFAGATAAYLQPDAVSVWLGAAHFAAYAFLAFVWRPDQLIDPRRSSGRGSSGGRPDVRPDEPGGA